MRNKFENMSNNTRKKQKKVDELKHPFGERNEFGSEGAEDMREIGNAIFSIPSLLKIRWLEGRIRAGKNKLEKIYAQSQEEAIKLNQQYDSLIEEAAASGDDAKIKAFETKELGMDK